MLVAATALLAAIACPYGTDTPPLIPEGSAASGTAGDASTDAGETDEILSRDGAWRALYVGVKPRYGFDHFGTFVEGPSSLRVLVFDYTPGTKDIWLQELGWKDGVPINRIIWRDESWTVPSALYLRDGTVWLANWTRGYPMPLSAFWLRKHHDAVEVASCPNGGAAFKVQSEAVEDGQQLVVPYLCDGECNTSSESLVIRLLADGGVRKNCIRTATTGSMPPDYWLQAADGTEIFTSRGTGFERQILSDMQVVDGGRLLDVIEFAQPIAYTGAKTETPVLAEVSTQQPEYTQSLALIGLSLGPDGGAHIRPIPGTKDVTMRGSYARIRGRFVSTFNYVYDPIPRLGILDPVAAEFSSIALPRHPSSIGAFGSSNEIATDGTRLYQVARINHGDGGYEIHARRVPEFDSVVPP